MDDAYPGKIFNNKIIFNSPLFAYMGAAQLLDCTTARTTNGRVIKGELLLWLPFLFVHLGCGSWRASACCVLESRNEREWYAVVVVKDGTVVRFLFKVISRILEELHVLSKGIILELIRLFKNSVNKYPWFHRPTKIFNAEKFPDYNALYSYGAWYEIPYFR